MNISTSSSSFYSESSQKFELPEIECKSDITELAELIEQQNIHDLVIDASSSPDRYIGRFLKRMTQLHSLIISNSITQPIIESLVELLQHPCTTQLTTLQFTDNKLSKVQCKQILEGCAKRCKCLENLSFDNNNIDIPSLNYLLSESPSLETLRLKWNGLSSESFVQLSKGIASCYSLKRLFIEENDIGDEGAIAIFKALVKANSVEVLSLRNTNISSKSTEVIGKYLTQYSSLEILCLPNNKLQSEGIKHFKVLLEKKNLTELDLSSNNIGVEGAKVISDSLKNNTNLLRLNLRNNNLKDEGAILIAASLTENDNLQYLSLSKNIIGDDGARALCIALTSNKSIETVDLNVNRITERSAGYFEDLGKVSVVLRGIGLSFNLLGPCEQRINMIFEIKELLCKCYNLKS